jgi:hypothetical protein
MPTCSAGGACPLSLAAPTRSAGGARRLGLAAPARAAWRAHPPEGRGQGGGRPWGTGDGLAVAIFSPGAAAGNSPQDREKDHMQEKRALRSSPFFKRDGSASSQYIPASEMAPLQQFSTKHKYKWNGTALFHLTPQPNATLEMGERPTPAQPGSIKRNKKNKVITVHNLHTPIQP